MRSDRFQAPLVCATLAAILATPAQTATRDTLGGEPPPFLCVENTNPTNNCSVETGAFPPWLPMDHPTPFVALHVGMAGETPGFGLFTSAPTEGTFAILHGFDGGGPGAIRVPQDLTVPRGTPVLTFDYRAGWDMVTFPGSTLPRTFEVHVEPAGGGPPLLTQLILTAPPATMTLDTGDQRGVLNLSAFAGQRVRLVFQWNIPEMFTGPGHFQLDNVHIKARGRGTLYGSTNLGQLFVVDLATGAATTVGTLTSCGAGGSTEIEYDQRSERSFSQSRDGGFCGVEYRAGTGAAVGVAVPNTRSFNGLETVNGIWYGTSIMAPGGPSDLRTLNPFTGASVPIGPTGVGPVSGLAWDGTTMYGIAGDVGPAALYRMNLTTGAATVIGMTSIQAGSLEFGPDGQLYAGGTGPNQGNLYRINPTTAASTLVGPTGIVAGISGLTHVRGAYVKGDFDFAGRPDFLWRHSESGENVVWFMNGADLVSGTFTNPSAITDVRWNMVGTNDFNDDGWTDILWRHSTEGENVVWFMNGVNLVTGTFTNPSALADPRWDMVGTGDFNLDTRPDILWRHSVSGENVIWFMNGVNLVTGTFTNPPTIADVRWRMVGVGDFNRDTRPDIAWRHLTSGENVIWFMNGPDLVSGTFTNPSFADTTWAIRGVADFNVDAWPDLIWRNSLSGQNVIWFMNGPNLVSGTFTNPSTLPDTRWQIVGPR